MKTISGFLGFTGSAVIVLMIVGMVAGINWLTSEQENIHIQNQLTDTPVQQQFEQEKSDFSFADFLSGLEQTQLSLLDEDMTDVSSSNDYYNNSSLQTEEMMSQRDQKFEELQRLKRESEYQQLILTFSKDDGDDKVVLLQKIWQLAPEVGIDEKLLTLLNLATHDPDEKIERLAEKILIDLTRFRDGVMQPEVQLVSQIIEINNTQQEYTDQTGSSNELEIIEPNNLNRENSISTVEMIQLKNDKINKLAQLALNSEDDNQKKYALINLMQFDPDSALSVMQHQLLNSKDPDERYRVIENLNAATGDINSIKLRSILEVATSDYDSSIAEYAQVSLTMLDQYEKNLSDNSTIDVYTTVTQDSNLSDPSNSSY